MIAQNVLVQLSNSIVKHRNNHFLHILKHFAVLLSTFCIVHIFCFKAFCFYCPPNFLLYIIIKTLHFKNPQTRVESKEFFCFSFQIFFYFFNTYWWALAEILGVKSFKSCFTWLIQFWSSDVTNNVYQFVHANTAIQYLMHCYILKVST